MLARRFACPPVHEASYEPRQIPNAARDMSGTVILKPTREYLLTQLGEMVQMVNEAVRRRASTARDASKPLSLEYMADRLDVDDPLTGYMAFTKAEGWLQGFVTCTCAAARAARPRAACPVPALRRAGARRRVPRQLCA
jgi:hypothetical protein